jgi:guanosine-diphosphatase
MDGSDEGVFAWVTANYLLGSIRPDSAPSAADSHTVAVLDLGGASTQIVFAPVTGAPLYPGEHKYDLEFGGSTRVLYQHSYLGYGLMRARASVHRVVDFMAALHEMPPSAAGTVSNPCLARGTQRVIELAAEGGALKNVTMDGGDVGGFGACQRIVDLVLAKDAVCAVRPCAFGGVYQPALSEAFPASTGRVLLLSYFYDRVAPLVPPPEDGMQLATTVDAIEDLARTVCMGRDQWLKKWGTQAELMKELEGRPEWCLDLTFMHRLLRTGWVVLSFLPFVEASFPLSFLPSFCLLTPVSPFPSSSSFGPFADWPHRYEFDGDREVMYGKKIAGTELGWCLGAGIKLVGGVDVQCRV